MLDDADRQEIRESIEAQKERLERTIERLEAQMQPIPPDRAIGRLTRMEAINSRSVAHTSLQSARRNLARLTEVEARIGDEDYGVCSRCRRPIPTKRLLLAPDSRVCVACASPR
jgi:DnaK suppressor protein